MTNKPAPDDDDGGHFLLEFQGDQLDPAALIQVITLKTLGRPKKKGDPIGRVSKGKMPVVKTGYCGFFAEDCESADVNKQLESILKIVDTNIQELRHIVETHALNWDAILFPGPSGKPSFADLDPDLIRWAARLGLPLMQRARRPSPSSMAPV